MVVRLCMNTQSSILLIYGKKCVYDRVDIYLINVLEYFIKKYSKHSSLCQDSTKTIFFNPTKIIKNMYQIIIYLKTT